MPFDSLPEPQEQTVVESEGHARLRQLARDLRDRMPANFAWDFAIVTRPHECGTAGCAVGLEMHLRPGFRTSVAFSHAGLWSEKIAPYFGLDQQTAGDLFFDAGTYGRSSMTRVKPLDVAEAIDRFLTTGAL